MPEIELDYKKIGQDVKAARLRMQMTQTELAAKVGCHMETIRNIEEGTRGGTTLLPVLNYLGLVQYVGLSALEVVEHTTV